jgi:hypothetical protein
MTTPIPSNSVSGTLRLKHQSAEATVFLTRKFSASSGFEAALRLGFDRVTPAGFSDGSNPRAQSDVALA